MACEGGDPILVGADQRRELLLRQTGWVHFPRVMGPTVHSASLSGAMRRACTLFSQDWWAGITFTHKIITQRDCT